MAVGDAGYQQGSKGLYPWTSPEKSGDVNAAGFSPGLGSMTPDSLQVLANSGIAAYGGTPIYLVGDSNVAVANREPDFALGSVSGNAFVWSGSILVPPGTRMRTYGFADERLNFEGVLQYVGGLPTLAIPTPGIADGAMTAYPASVDATLRRAQAASSWGDRGIPFWVHAVSGNRYRWVNRARSGSDTRAHARYLVTDIAGEKGVVVIVGTMNDAINNVPEATTAANYRAMFTEVKAQGHRLVVITNTTFGTAQAGYLALNKRQIRQAQLLRTLAREFKADLLDMMDIQIDKTSAEAIPTVGRVQADGIHWTPTLLQLAAPLLVPLLDGNGAGSVPIRLLSSSLDARFDAAGAAVTGNETNTNVMRNGHMAGTTSTGIAGGPDLYLIAKHASATLTPTKTASPLGADKKTLFTFTTTASGQDFSWTGSSVHAEATVGKKMTCSCKLDVDTAVAFSVAFGLLLTFTSAGTDQPTNVYTTDVVNPVNTMPTGAYSITLTTPEFEIPAGYTLTAAKPYGQVSGRAAMTTEEFSFSQVTVDADAA